jgi:hypothetical protein
MGTQRGQIKEVRFWLVLLACRAGTRDFCSSLAALVGPVQNTFFLTIHHFHSFVPSAQQAGQATVLGHLSLCMCLWLQQAEKEAAINQLKSECPTLGYSKKVLLKILWSTSIEDTHKKNQRYTTQMISSEQKCQKKEIVCRASFFFI